MASLELMMSSECTDFAALRLWKSRLIWHQERNHVVENQIERAKYQENRDENMNDRSAAWGLLTEFTQSESLRKHALSVEACMRAYAQKFSGDQELWGIV